MCGIAMERQRFNYFKFLVFADGVVTENNGGAQLRVYGTYISSIALCVSIATHNPLQKGYKGY